jgi:hypothetical protein
VANQTDHVGIGTDCLDELLGGPRGIGMRRHVDVQDAPPLLGPVRRDRLPAPEAWRSAQFLREKGRVNARFEIWDSTGSPIPTAPRRPKKRSPLGPRR